MERAEIEAALREVAIELDRKNVQARIYLVGGAVMVLAYNARFSTNDVDAFYFPPQEVDAIAATVGQRRGLPEGWLSDAAKIFIPVFREPNWQPVFKVGVVEIVAADERSMLAMKLRASRGRRDREDIRFLVHQCRLTNKTEALTLYDEFFPEDPLSAQGKAALDAVFDPQVPGTG